MNEKRVRKHSNRQPKISMAYNKHVLFAYRSLGWLQFCWSQLGSVGNPRSSHSMTQDEEAAIACGFLCKGTEAQGQDKLKVLLKIPSQNWPPSFPFILHWSGKAHGKAQSQGDRKESIHCLLGSMDK